VKSSIARFLVLVLVLLPAVAPVAAADGRTVLVLGDSLSAAYNLELETGWVSLLARRLARHRPPYAVINASISGDTTAGGRARLPALLAAHRPAIVVIELGGNDGLRALAPAQTRANLEAMVRAAQAAGAEVLLLGVRLPPNYGTAYNERFLQVYRDVARAHDAALVPFLLAGVDDRPSLMQADGIHPTAEAQPRILENVWAALRPLLEARARPARQGRAAGPAAAAGGR
jgi:acyl-CoA thioesterase-1